MKVTEQTEQTQDSTVQVLKCNNYGASTTPTNHQMMRMVCPIIDLTYLGSASVSQDRSDEIADYAFCNGVYIIL